MLMSIIKLTVVSSFLTAKKYWNSRNSNYRTYPPVPTRRDISYPTIDDSKPILDNSRHRIEQRHIFSPRPRL